MYIGGAARKMTRSSANSFDAAPRAASVTAISKTAPLRRGAPICRQAIRSAMSCRCPFEVRQSSTKYAPRSLIDQIRGAATRSLTKIGRPQLIAS